MRRWTRKYGFYLDFWLNSSKHEAVYNCQVLALLLFNVDRTVSPPGVGYIYF